jgi:hypothetical protein
MKSKIMLTFIVCGLLLSGWSSVLGQAEKLGLNTTEKEEVELCVGDRFVIRGMSFAIRMEGSNIVRSRAFILLKCCITDISGLEVKFEIESGSITVDEDTWGLQGKGSLNLKGRHANIHLEGDEGKIFLQGRARLLRGRIVLFFRGRGNIGDGNYGFRFLCVAYRVATTEVSP